MTGKLLVSAIVKFLIGIVLVGVLLFLPAGTIVYVNGWLLMGVLFVPILLAGVVMMCKNPALLARRLDAKEKIREQGMVVKLTGLMFLLGFVLAGLGVRFAWYTLPKTVSYIFAGVFLLAYLLYAEVLRENTYLSRTISVAKGQTVVDTGLYGIVRHPMYSVTLLLFLSMPLILGSVYAFLIFLAYPFLIARRIQSEEAFLEGALAGYAEYKKKVKYRMIPFIY